MLAIVIPVVGGGCSHPVTNLGIVLFCASIVLFAVAVALLAGYVDR